METDRQIILICSTEDCRVGFESDDLTHFLRIGLLALLFQWEHHNAFTSLFVIGGAVIGEIFF